MTTTTNVPTTTTVTLGRASASATDKRAASARNTRNAPVKKMIMLFLAAAPLASASDLCSNACTDWANNGYCQDGGPGSIGGAGGGAAEAVRAARAERDEAEAAKEALRSELRAQLLEAVSAREALEAQLASAKAGHAPEVQRLGAERDASVRELERERGESARLRAELEEAHAAREKLLVQARLDGAALSSREREYAQQLNGKEVQVAALERELATMAGQLVAAQAEAKSRQAAQLESDESARRERAALLQAREALEADKAELHAQLKARDSERAELLDTIGQCGSDRDFCYAIIKELKEQLAAARSE